jgi:phosphotransferase system enzyme I (PtsP)
MIRVLSIKLRENLREDKGGVYGVRANASVEKYPKPSYRVNIGFGCAPENVETLNLDEAAAHPNFRYVPETGEERFHSFAGVPIVRSERAVGVLAVQHVEPRKYEEVEIEALQTVAMVLSELIANADLVDEPSARGGNDTGTISLTGLPLVKGAAAGVAIFHQPNVRIEHTVAEDVEAERHRVYSAFDKMREQIDRMASQIDFGTGGVATDALLGLRRIGHNFCLSRVWFRPRAAAGKLVTVCSKMGERTHGPTAGKQRA